MARRIRDTSLMAVQDTPPAAGPQSRRREGAAPGPLPGTISRRASAAAGPSAADGQGDARPRNADHGHDVDHFSDRPAGSWDGRPAKTIPVRTVAGGGASYSVQGPLTDLHGPLSRALQSAARDGKKVYPRARGRRLTDGHAVVRREGPMPGPIASVFRVLRQAAGATEAADAALLQQFVAHRNEDAFAALLQRYGPLVFAACRRALRERADAEDAFQATFLVLARKAGSIRKQDALAAWLHRVALNISRTIKLAAARRQAHERQVADMAQAPPPDGVDLRDWQSVLHEEVDQLPEKYRVPVILCYLQGLTHEEAARHLGWPLGSVKGRLARARDRLRTRLGRRGLTLTGAALTAALAEGAAAAVPPALLGLTFRAALSFASGGAVVSARALTLAKGAVPIMAARELVQATLLLLAVALVGVGAGFGLGSWPQTRARGPALESREPTRKEGMADGTAGAKAARVEEAIQLTLASVRPEYKTGEAVDLTLTIKNNGKDPFSHLLYKITHLFDFAMTGPDGKEVAPASNPVEIGYASTPVTVPPGEAVTIKT